MAESTTRATEQTLSAIYTQLQALTSAVTVLQNSFSSDAVTIVSPTDFPDVNASARLDTAITSLNNILLELQGVLDISIASGSVGVTNFPVTYPNGHTQPLTETQLLASDPATQATLAAVLAKQFELEFRSADERPTEVRYAERLTASATITPAAGKAIRIRKIGWVPYEEPNTVLLRWADVGAGVKAVWRANATQQTVYETGAVDRALEIVLLNANPIDVNVHYEVTP